MRLLLLLLTACLTDCHKIAVNQPSVHENLAKATAIMIERTYFNLQPHITVVKSISDKNLRKFFEIFTALVESFNQTFTFHLEDARTLKPLQDRRRSNIFFIDSAETFDEICRQLLYDNFKMRKLFTVISISVLESAEMSKIFDCFFERLVIDAAIIAHDANKTVNLFTFFPYRSAIECDNTNPIKVNSFGARRWSHEKFYYRRSNDLKGCPLRIGAAAVTGEPAVMHRNLSNGQTELLGIEKEIFMEFARLLNFTPDFKIYFESIGTVFVNGTGIRVLGRVRDNLIDTAIGFNSLQYERTLFLSETKHYAMNNLAIVIPKGEEYGDMEKLLRPFSLPVWLCLLVIFLISSILSLTFLKVPIVYNFVVGREVKHPFTSIIAIHLGVSQPKLPMRNFSRFILMNFLVYCLILRSSYEGAVYNILMSDDRKSPAYFIDQMMEKNFKFYVFESLAGRLKAFAAEFPFHKNIRVFPNAEIDTYRRKTLQDGFKGAVFNYENQIHFLNWVNAKNYTFTIAKERMYTTPFVFYFRKNHFLVSDINSYLERMHANGLIDFISSRYADKGGLKTKPDEGPRALQIKHIYGATEVYFLCNLIAVVVFIMELVTKLRLYWR